MNTTVNIQRICVRAKPRSTNPDYFDWQTAIICIFVPQNDKLLAVKRARTELDRRHWEFISYRSKSTLIEERVRRAGGEVWEAYQSAANGDLVFKVFPEHFQAGDKGAKYLLPAKITEHFIDTVVDEAGGRRRANGPDRGRIRGVPRAIRPRTRRRRPATGSSSICKVAGCG